MARMTRTTMRALLAGVAATVAIPSVTVAQDQIGGFDVEITKSKKRKRVKKQDIVDVRLDPNWKGPKSIDEALDMVKDGGEVVVHPGVYRPEFISLRKSVTIRGIRDSYGEAPTLVADGGCLSVGRHSVSARLSDLTFAAGDRTCISVSKGQLEIEASEIRGKNASDYYRPMTVSDHLTPFSETAAVGSNAALVSIRGGRVSITNSRIVGGETGVMISPDLTGNAFEHVFLRENEISQMERAGVVMVGNVDATLSSNRILANGMGGVVYSASGHARLVDNIISNNAYSGVYIASGDREAISVERNKIHDNTRDGIKVRSGVAILVGNEIGEHDGCRVREEPFDRTTSQHLARPPITLLADAAGVNAYRTPNGCEKGELRSSNDRRRGSRRR